MKILIFGSTGMVGQGALRECLAADDVREVVAFVRATSGATHPKLREVVHADFFAYDAVKDELRGVDACLFCLGVSAGGMNEATYTRLTHDLTLAAAHALREQSPHAAFLYVSGAGTDSTEKGRAMWARVKGRTENALLALFPRAVMFRPGLIRPMHGERSKTPLYRALYVALSPLLGLLHAAAPRFVTSTEEVGRAMLAVARHGAPQRVLESRDIGALARRA